MTQFKLRQYQEEAVSNVKRSFTDKIHTQLLVLPTGAGKTCIIIAIARHYRKKTLILAHRDELITQAYDKFRRFWPQANIGIYKGKNKRLDHMIVITSVQTASKKKQLKQLKKKGFNVLIIDEAHHAPSDSYQQIINELGFADDPAKLLIGVTATPNRSDNKPLSSIFQETVYSISINTLIKEGHLSPVVARRILTNLTVAGIKTRMGDFAVDQLAEAVNIPERNAFIASKYKEHASGRKTIVFCVDVQHCKDLAETFNKAGISAAAVWGTMKQIDRKQILDDFRAGKITVVTSCALLTEGFDEPSVACIIVARPTKSQCLYTQMIGRGLRKDETPDSTKKNCLILDFTDKHNNLNATVSLATVLPDVPVTIDRPTKTQTNLTGGEQKIRADITIDKTFNILGNQNLAWVDIGNEEWSLMDDDNNEIVITPVDNSTQYVAKCYVAVGGEFDLVEEPTSYNNCKKMCEDYAQKHMSLKYADKNGPWMQAAQLTRATEGQLRTLGERNGARNNMTMASASLAIRRMTALKRKQEQNRMDEPVTVQQKFYLNRRGIDSRGMTKRTAMRVISEHKQWESSFERRR